jgi:hypothetical protein
MIRRSSLGRIASAAALLCVAGMSADARAQQTSIYERDTAYLRAKRIQDSPQWFALELRFAPYVPKIDSAPELAGKTPFCAVYGTVSSRGVCTETPNPRFMFGLEFDVQVLKIPYVGTLGPGVSFSYLSVSRPALVSATGQPSGQDTSIEIFPLYGSAVLRVDVLHKQFGVPIVPYAKAGLGLGFWRNYSPNGTIKFNRPDGTEQGAKGYSFGTHFAFGGMLRLDFLEPDSARTLDDAIGINHVSLFGEYMLLNLNQSGALRVGANTAVFGVTTEF